MIFIGVLTYALLFCRCRAFDDSLLKYASLDKEWLKEALLWNDEVDGRPETTEEIESGLKKLESRLGLEEAFRANFASHNFTFQSKRGGDSHTVVLRSTACDNSIGPLVLKELKNDEYDTAGHPLSEPGSIALDIGGHVGAAALQVAVHATARDSGVITFEPTRENYLFNQWNMWVNGFHQNRVVVLHTGVNSEEALMEIRYSPRDTTGAGKHRHRFRHEMASGPCKERAPYKVRMMGIETGLVDLGVLERVGGGGAPRQGRSVAFVKLDCEGCEYGIVRKFKSFWRDHVAFVTGEMHHHYAGCVDNVHETVDALCAIDRDIVNRASNPRLCDRAHVKGIPQVCV